MKIGFWTIALTGICSMAGSAAAAVLPMIRAARIRPLDALTPSSGALLSGGFFSGILLAIWVMNAVVMAVLEAILFWSGMLRVYLTSVQLGLKHRILAALCGWIPFLNIWYLTKIIRITSEL